MPTTLDAVMFVADPPEFRIDEDGLVHITQHYGKGGLCIERVMRLRTFFKTIHMAKKAIAEYEARGRAEVIAFPKRKSAPAH